MTMDLIIFDIEGYMGHFRKIYSTTSSLTYLFPPRTTITGMIAGILGRERDSYYTEFSPKECNVALSILSPLRIHVSTVNYLFTTAVNEEHLRGLTPNRTQILQEFVYPEPPYSVIKYRIFFYHKNDDLMTELDQRLQNHSFVYPPYLGQMCHLGSITFSARLSVDIIEAKNGDSYEISTVIPLSKTILLPNNQGKRIKIEDRVPVYFDNNRNIVKVDNYMVEENGQSINIELKEEAKIFKSIKITTKGKGTVFYGIFME